MSDNERKAYSVTLYPMHDGRWHAYVKGEGHSEFADTREEVLTKMQKYISWLRDQPQPEEIQL